MQVLFDESEYRVIAQAARRQGQTIADFVRQALRGACRQQPTGNTDKKIAVVRAAARHGFPTADIDTMLAQIERGYGGDE